MNTSNTSTEPKRCEGRRVRWWFIGLSGVLQIFAAAIADLILYEKVIVPLLPGVKSVPLWWWGLQTAPIWMAALLLGWQTLSIRELLAAAWAGAMGNQILLYWASVTLRAGFPNQPLAETDPLMFWTLGSLVSWVLLTVLYLVGYMTSRRKKQNVLGTGKESQEQF